MKDKLTAFIGGFIFSTAFNLQMLVEMFADFAVKAITTALLGVVGGLAGIFAKDYIWPKLKKKFKL